MAAENSSFDRTRELLCEKIVDVLRSWPETQRRVFVLSHYNGHSPEDISLSLGLRTGEVRVILEQCERRLRGALKSFRETCLQDDEADPAATVSLASSGCCV